MHISFCGRNHNGVDHTLVKTDTSYAIRWNSDEFTWADNPAIKVDETGLVVRAETEHNPNSHMAGTYVVEVRFTETEIANLAMALWGGGSFETAIDALSRRTERGQRVGQIERWRRKATEAASNEDRDHAERRLRQSIDQLASREVETRG
jgi:hypothetical protein